jgi:hypothetical protein
LDTPVKIPKKNLETKLKFKDKNRVTGYRKSEPAGLFQHNAERLLRLIEKVYRCLPLGTVVNNKVLVVHGGVSDTTDLDWVRNLDRQKVRFTNILCGFKEIYRNSTIKKFAATPLQTVYTYLSRITSLFYMPAQKGVVNMTTATSDIAA